MSPVKLNYNNHIFLKHKKIIIIIDLVKEIIKYSEALIMRFGNFDRRFKVKTAAVQSSSGDNTDNSHRF